MEASLHFNPNDPENPCECETGDCKCKDVYEVLEDKDTGKFYILKNGCEAAGPMSKSETEDWLDKRENEG